jgi:hypothetical protein
MISFAGAAAHQESARKTSRPDLSSTGNAKSDEHDGNSGPSAHRPAWSFAVNRLRTEPSWPPCGKNSTTRTPVRNVSDEFAG